MRSQTKWNKELLYSIIFFVVAIMFFFLNPLDQIRDLIEMSPNELSIKYTLLGWGIYPIFSNVANIAIFGSIFFLLCSVYIGIKSVKKASVVGERKIFGLIPKNINIPNIPGLLATLVVLISLSYLLLNASIAIDFLD